MERLLGHSVPPPLVRDCTRERKRVLNEHMTCHVGEGASDKLMREEAKLFQDQRRTHLLLPVSIKPKQDSVCFYSDTGECHFLYHSGSSYSSKPDPGPELILPSQHFIYLFENGPLFLKNVSATKMFS